MKAVVLMPCFDDADTAAELVDEVAMQMHASGHKCRFLIVDDGSTRSLMLSLQAMRLPDRVDVLPLVRNLGHQRAIACGLCALNANDADTEVVVVMDSDGEDQPSDVVRLVDAMSVADQSTKIIFAERRRRTEGLIFRFGYVVYLILHRLMLGQAARVGNFCVMRRALVAGLVTDSDIWSHFAATVWKSRVVRSTIPVCRGVRRRGSSKLNFGGLVLHGLSAIACYRETLVLRVLLAIFAVLALAIFLAISGGTIGLWEHWFASPEAWMLVAALSWMLLHSMIMALWQCFSILQGRNQATFIPIKDYQYFAPSGVVPIQGKSNDAS